MNSEIYNNILNYFSEAKGPHQSLTMYNYIFKKCEDHQEKEIMETTIKVIRNEFITNIKKKINPTNYYELKENYMSLFKKRWNIIFRYLMRYYVPCNGNVLLRLDNFEMYVSDCQDAYLHIWNNDIRNELINNTDYINIIL